MAHHHRPPLIAHPREGLWRTELSLSFFLEKLTSICMYVVYLRFGVWILPDDEMWVAIHLDSLYQKDPSVACFSTYWGVDCRVGQLVTDKQSYVNVLPCIFFSFSILCTSWTLCLLNIWLYASLDAEAGARPPFLKILKPELWNYFWGIPKHYIFKNISYLNTLLKGAAYASS